MLYNFKAPSVEATYENHRYEIHIPWLTMLLWSSTPTYCDAFIVCLNVDSDVLTWLQSQQIN